MGYTHYWTQPRNFNQLEFAEITEAVRKIIAQAEGKSTASAGGYYANQPVRICGWNGTGEPTFDGERISFNGNGPDLDHETFVIERQWEASYEGAPERWTFCKTARKPYDVVVVACLTYLAAKWGYDVSSDGDAADLDDGVKLAALALGEIFPNPLQQQAAA